MSDPSLILDRREDIAAPGLHAILIGVSNYIFLEDPDSPPREGLAALKKLESAALSAWQISEKLIDLDGKKRLLRPLKTVRLLIAPSAVELAAVPQLAAAGTAPICATIRSTLKEWRSDVSNHQDEQALFHFSGHGIRRSLEDTILLASDFLDPAEDVELNNAFNLRSIYNGMVPSKKYPEIGREQFYFVDACRDKPDALDELEDTETPKVFKAALGGLDDRKAPILFATKTGGSAAGLPGQPTYFTEALLWAIEHGSFGAVEMAGVPGSVWPVSAQSLKAGVEAIDTMFHNRIELTGLAADPILCFRADPPTLPLQVAFRPSDVEPNVDAVWLRELNQNLDVEIKRRTGQPVWEESISAGSYRLTVKAKAGAFPTANSGIEFLSVQRKMPWTFTIGAGL